jgi:hypothetical protein
VSTSWYQRKDGGEKEQTRTAENPRSKARNQSSERRGEYVVTWMGEGEEAKMRWKVNGRDERVYGGMTSEWTKSGRRREDGSMRKGRSREI